MYNNSPRVINYTGPGIIKLFSHSAQLRLKFILVINVKMPTIVGILAFISQINYRLWRYFKKQNFILFWLFHHV